jgi:MraZ protein
MGLFVSTFINKLDKKGRVSVPSSFRAALSDQNFSGVVLYPSFQTDGVIEGCGMDFLEKIALASDQQLDVFSQEQNDLHTLLYSSAHSLAFDPEGRIAIPDILLSLLKSPEQVAFVGLGRNFQIWAPDHHQAYKQDALLRLQKNRPKLILSQSRLEEEKRS